MKPAPDSDACEYGTCQHLAMRRYWLHVVPGASVRLCWTHFAVFARLVADGHLAGRLEEP